MYTCNDMFHELSFLVNEFFWLMNYEYFDAYKLCLFEQ
jgi:hypothetical protein